MRVALRLLSPFLRLGIARLYCQAIAGSRFGCTASCVILQYPWADKFSDQNHSLNGRLIRSVISSIFRISVFGFCGGVTVVCCLDRIRSCIEPPGTASLVKCDHQPEK